ncbi:MAG: alkaline phosphatase D family protein [Lutibacter sp.]|uniref:alkaline phosphatase D family protein n=1 Tax=Lutibacter sp. TaxID=1925666 RepID=UPI00299D8990|nr:alkaline phosphatase D family protein [Lutibacter sp.]MDX1830197.1 alkaline phosphatase D family protein [Lutibacter sp.]
MTQIKQLFLIFLLLASCKNNKKTDATSASNIHSDFTIAFGSCNNQNLPNLLWKEIAKNNPSIFIFEGDMIYSDTENMEYLKKNYDQQKNNPDYKKFVKKIPVLATWDDHDYGENDGGADYPKKVTSQKLYLDFYNVPSDDVRRKREGVYYSKNFKIDTTNIKIILLDTRYFRTHLTPDTTSKKRYKPNKYGQGTMLGDAQWKWLQNELENSKASYTIIASSIQFLSDQHGFECWGNMPHEYDKLIKLLASTKTKNAIILSGDRHISEISKKEFKNLNYPLIDFTSSGLTHSYTNFKSEINPYRIGKVIPYKNFGLLKFDFKNKKVIMETRGEKNILYATYTQKY